jgi:hypothetical protein
MYALFHGPLTHILCGDYLTAAAQADESVELADAKGALVFKALGMLGQGYSLALTGKAADAIQVITTGNTALQTTGAALWTPLPCHIWRGPMRSLASSTMLGAALARR